MQTLTLRKAVRLHRRMWRWIARKTRRTGVLVTKDDYFRRFRYLNIPESQCYMCEYATQQNISKNANYYKTCICNYCPLDWGNEEPYFYMCEEGEGLYKLWRISESPIKRAEYAKKIADLPLKDGLKNNKEGEI